MKIDNYFPKLVRASLDNDQRAVQSIAMRLIRRYKGTDPVIAEEISKALEFYNVGLNSKRSIGIESAPMDEESRRDLLNVEEPISIDRPIMSEKVNSFIDELIIERQEASQLISAGLNPPSSILVYGPPGVGKTYLAQYLSGVFNMKFATLDLATVISSYLGKTGQNLKSVLDYARKEPTLLLLDEFDAVAKKRDDASDLGELKRIVNVLLKELEDWPYYSILMAATNHPELLDKAIWRRFDHVIEIKLPDIEQRKEILGREMENIQDSLENGLLNVIGELTEDFSGADLCKIVEKAKRKTIINKNDFNKNLFQELVNNYNGDNIEFNKKFCKSVKENTTISIRTLAEWLNKSPSTIQYYLK